MAKKRKTAPFVEIAMRACDLELALRILEHSRISGDRDGSSWGNCSPDEIVRIFAVEPSGDESKVLVERLGFSTQIDAKIAFGE